MTAFMEVFFKEFKAKSQKQNPLTELLNLKQIGIVVEYYDQFVFLLENVELFEGDAISLFLNELKNSIHQHVKMFMPTTLQQAFVIAKFQEFILKKLHQESTTTLQQSLLLPKSPSNTQNHPQTPTFTTRFPIYLKYIQETSLFGYSFQNEKQYRF